MTQVLDLRFDPRWKRLNDPAFVCRVCGQRHGGVIEMVFEKPYQWQGGEKQDETSPDIDPRNYLLEDFCVIDNKQFFIRAVIALKILGSSTQDKAETEQYLSVWVSVSATDFDRYGDTYSAVDQSTIGPMSGKLANRIGSFPDTADLPVVLSPQNGNLRPVIFVDAPEHPLTLAQQKGVTFEDILTLYAASGHDMRPGLSVVN